MTVQRRVTFATDQISRMAAANDSTLGMDTGGTKSESGPGEADWLDPSAIGRILPIALTPFDGPIALDFAWESATDLPRGFGEVSESSTAQSSSIEQMAASREWANLVANARNETFEEGVESAFARAVQDQTRRLRGPFIRGLGVLSNDPTVDARYICEAIAAISRMQRHELPVETVRLMSELLTSSRPSIRYSAANALCEIQRSGAVSVLQQALRVEKNTLVKMLIESKLRQL